MKLFFLVIALVFLSNSLFSASKKMVIVEEYSSAYCGTCGYFDPTFKSVTNQNINDVIPLSFHTGNAPGDIMYKHNPQVSGRFSFTYGVTQIGTPAVWIDGKNVSYTQYGSLPTYTGGTSPVSLKVVEERTSDKLNITVGIETDVALKNHTLFVFIVEDNLYYPNAGTNGVKDFRWVVRKGLPAETAGQNLVMEANSRKGYTYSVDWHPDWNRENIHVVAFVQSFGQMDKFAILNGAKTGEHSLEPIISSSETTVDFGNTVDKKELELLLLNDGLKDINVSEISLNNNEDGAFRIKFGTSTTKIPAYGSAKVVLEFFPKENGQYNSELVVVSDAKNASTYKVNLKGEATNIVPFGQIAAEDDFIEFGEVNKPTTKNAIINNIGTGPLVISSISLDYNDEDAYELLLEETENITLNVGESLTIPISFTPKENDKFYFGDLLIVSDSKEEQEYVVSLSGRGKELAGGPSLVLSDGATTLEYGEIEPGKTTSFKIKNTTNANIQITDISFVDFEEGSNDNEAFQLISAKSTWAVANSETSVAFKFNPSESKEYKVYVNITTKDNKDDMKIELSATANLASVFGNELSASGALLLNISPNPIINSSEISFINNSNDLLVLDLYNTNGELINNLYNGKHSNYSINFDSSKLSNGKYFLIATINGKREAFSIIINK